MGLREFWDRLMGGDKEERVEETMDAAPTDAPPELDDYQEMRDERAVKERYGNAPSSFDE